MDEDLLDIISKEFSFFSQEELEQAVQQARREIQADLGKLIHNWSFILLYDHQITFYIKAI